MDSKKKKKKNHKLCNHQLEKTSNFEELGRYQTLKHNYINFHYAFEKFSSWF